MAMIKAVFAVEVIETDKGDVYFRLPNGHWVRNLHDKRQVIIAGYLEQKYQSYKKKHD